MVHDVVIVGAGSAGCVLAARLAERGDRSVLLLEAGPDLAPGQWPPEIRSGYQPSPSHDWGYRSEARDGIPPIELWRARIVGGCSATNATMALRGRPSDFDEWAACGNPGWSFADVLPAFRRLETDLDFDGPWHGRDGPLPIRRYRPDEWIAGQGEFVQACEALGHARVDDHNAPGAIGIGPVPVNTVGGLRQSTAVRYLAPARRRANLAVRGAAPIDRVECSHGRVTGVCLADGTTVGARQVVLSAGAFGSPAILWRSGIGPADALRRLGIRVREDRPGVGQGLCDHPRIGLRFAAPAACAAADVPGCQVVLTMASSAARGGHDLHLFPWSIAAAADSPTGAKMTIHVALMKPRSRGELRLRSADPAAAPIIDPGWFADPDDLPRLVEGVKTARALAACLPLAAIATRELLPGVECASDAELAAAIRAHLGTYFHPVGTCRMGPAGDAHAVVDAHGAVHGVDGLWVVDASVMPTIPAANTQLATLMIAERCAEGLAAAA